MFAVLLEGKGSHVVLLLLELIVVLVVLSDVVVVLTLCTLKSNCLSWAFFCFCHRFFLEAGSIPYLSLLGDSNPGPTVYKTAALTN